MGDMKYGCPLCCNELFNSKLELIAHLSSKLENLTCPICNNTWSSVLHLIEHLTSDDCQPNNTDDIPSEDINNLDKRTESETPKITFEISKSVIQNYSDQNFEGAVNGDVNRVCVDLLDKQMLKPGYIQDLKLVQSNGSNQYLITIANEDTDTNTTYVTQQNTDGTISISPIAVMKLEPESEEIATKQNEEEVQKNTEETVEEVYSCNACGVSFTSVLEHIQNNHSDQEVVVAEPMEHLEERKNESTELDYDVIIQNSITTHDMDQEVQRNVVKSPAVDITQKNQVKYSCPHCPVTYMNPKSLSAHMKVHKVKTVSETADPLMITYVCGICCTRFPTNKSLKLHKRMHDPIKARPIQPPVSVGNGVRMALNQDYHCDICDKVIPMSYKNIHVKSHQTTNEMNCTICNKRFTSQEYLEMHMNVHNTDKVPKSNQNKSLPYKCLFCERRFARPHEKVKHERIHTGEKPHSCEICGKSFRVSYCLTLHMRTHTGARPYACPQCPKRFKAHSVFNHHLLTHSDVRAYKCTFCPKAFKTAVQLAGHKNSHTKPFSCQQCNRPFASLYGLRIHNETHARHNNLKFSCSLCGASYARAFALKDHVKQVHHHDIDTDNVTNQEEWTVKEKTDKVKVDTAQELSEEIKLDMSQDTIQDTPVEDSTSTSADPLSLW